tara:strand:+ start:11558 stop:12121 length:564 start_codon:yes stop_codon:yes gene_type:complete
MKTVENNISNFLVISAMLFFVFLTRFSHELTPFALPDASLIIAFAAGILLKEIKYLVAVFLGIICLDNFAIYNHDFQNISLSNGSYFFHLAIYPIAWWFARKLKIFDLLNFTTIIFVVISLSFIISYGSYFYLYDMGLADSASLWSFLQNNFLSYFLTNISYAGLFFIGLKLYAKFKPTTLNIYVSK